MKQNKGDGSNNNPRPVPQLASLVLCHISATYAYNGQGKRISKTVNGVTTNYYYDGNEVILEKTGASSIYHIHSNRLDEIISDSRGYSYHYDGLGSVVNFTDSTGAKATSYNYKAFGSIRSQTGSVSNPWLFTGRQFDSESGMYFNRNRYYDARVGRFITRDPAGLNEGVNVYLYCNNDSINKIDPFGLEWITFYADRPEGNQFGDDSSIGDQSAVGHSFVSITDNQGNTVTRGFYPSEPLSATNSFSNQPGIIRNDAGHSYDGATISYYITTQQYNDVINSINTYNRPYNLAFNNCTDFVYQVANLSSIDLPGTDILIFTSPQSFADAITNSNTGTQNGNQPK